MLKKTLFPKNSLSKKLTIYLSVSLILAGGTALYLYSHLSSYQTSLDLEAKSKEYLVSISETLALPLWDVDEPKIRAVCMAYAKNDLIGAIKVVRFDGYIYFNEVNKDSGRMEFKTIPISHKGEEMGELTLALTSDYSRQLNRRFFWFYTFSLILLILSLSLCLSISLNIFFKHPLKQFVNMVESFASGDEDAFKKQILYAEFDPFIKVLKQMGDTIYQQMNSLKLTQYAIDHSIISTFWSDQNGRILYANDAACQASGFSRSEFLGASIKDMIPDISVDEQGTFESDEKRGSSFFETIQYKKDGSTFPVEVTANYFEYQQGHYIFVFTRDITERKHAEAALCESESRFRAAFDSAQDCVIIWDREYNCLYANQSAMNRIEVNPVNFAGRNTGNNLGHASDFMDIWKSRIDKVFETGKMFRFQDKQDNRGRLYYTDSIITPVFTEKKKVSSVCLVYRDVTELKQAEIALSQEKERLRVTLRSIGDGVITTDINGRVTLINKVAENLTGWTQPEAVGKDIKDIFNIINAKNGQRCGCPVENVLEAKKIIGLADHTSLISRDGTERMIADSGAPIIDTDTEIIGVVLVFRDITERKKMETQLRQTQKLESIGTLAGGVAHEINNPINGIMNYAQLIIDRTDDNSDVPVFAGEIIHETERVSTIVRNLLTFAREENEGHSLANLKDIVNNTISLIQTVFRGDQISLEIDIPDDLPSVKCRSQQIQQAVMNLVTNARDALNEKYSTYDENKKIIISSTLFQKEGADWIRITVEDKGKGIHADIQERLFDPFFTTKPRDVGTGIGLSISYGIIKNHYGELHFESQPGQYTKFHMDLPIYKG